MRFQNLNRRIFLVFRFFPKYHNLKQNIGGKNTSPAQVPQKHYFPTVFSHFFIEIEERLTQVKR